MRIPQTYFRKLDICDRANSFSEKRYQNYTKTADAVGIAIITLTPLAVTILVFIKKNWLYSDNKYNFLGEKRKNKFYQDC